MKHKNLLKNIQGILCVVVLLSSMILSLANIIEWNGKSIAFWYLMLWLWALDRALKSSDDVVSSLKIENETLKMRLESYEQIERQKNKQ